jgi:hypothetical protein
MWHAGRKTAALEPPLGRIAMKNSQRWGWASGLLFAATLASSSTSATEWSSMRCGNKLVSTGDPLYRVRTLCGEPDQMQSYVEFRTQRYRVRTECRKAASGQNVCEEVWSERTIEVPIDRLTYDFGPNKFVSYLMFEYGSLVRVDSGSYGVKN